ncbi:MAG: RHS repeat-associated core domain-containing protein [Rubrivivax sp.]|nr:RHS repeat-associated core domain-containing protein [Rubrivivax sp.]
MDRSGAAVETYEVSAFGELVNGNPRLRHQFTGEYWDREAQLQYQRQRWYQAGSARFASRDPHLGSPSDPRSQHAYAYAHSDPLNNIDPSGMMSLGEVGAAMSAQVNLALANVRAGFAISRAIGGSALRALGATVESAVERILIQTLGRSAVSSQIRLVGPGGRRVIDFMIQVKDRVALLEVKYGLPQKVGPAMTRLIGQIRTGTAAAAERDGVFVLFTWAAPSEAQMALLASQLGPGAGFVQHVHGLIGLTQWLRLFLLGI